ncbi:MAG: OmpH family outer membrane protein [Acidobacteriota bacterium]
MKAAILRTLVIASVLLAAASVQAQSKIGFINSETILNSLPEAQDAQKQLDALTTTWQTELTKMQSDLQKKFETYDKRKLIMSDKLRADAEKELQDLDKKMVDYRTAKFGTNGELFAKQNELMKPVQDKIFKAVKDVADEEGYDYVFDKTSTTLLMYANVKHDLTQKVIAKLTTK